MGCPPESVLAPLFFFGVGDEACMFSIHHLSLGASLPNATPQALVMTSNSPLSNPRSILVIDDNADAAESLSLLLKLLGHTVKTACDGYRGIRLAENHSPDVVIVDIGMPGMNGYEVARRIRHEIWGNQMMLVALTGWSREEDGRRAIEAGFDYHLVKPVSLETLHSFLSLRGVAGDLLCVSAAISD